MTKRLAAASFIALLCLTAASASPGLLPPTDLHASPGPDGTVELAWSPPPGAAGSLAYAVYADGVLEAVVQETHHVVPLGAPRLYAVTALQDGGESAANFLLVGTLHLAPWPLPGCPPLGTDIYTHYPFVAVAVYNECLPIAG